MLSLFWQYIINQAQRLYESRNSRKMQRSELENRVNYRRDITQIYKIIEKSIAKFPVWRNNKE